MRAPTTFDCLGVLGLKMSRSTFRFLGEQASTGEQRLVVGLTGYPNVGKSSTINALFGSKKTAVAATPGKTKHFQARNVSVSVCLK